MSVVSGGHREALALVELQGGGQGVQNAFGRTCQIAALHAHVVVDRDSGQHGDFLAPQTLDPTVAAVRRKPCLLRADACTPRTQELTHLGAWIDRGHTSTVGSPTGGWEVLLVPR